MATKYDSLKFNDFLYWILAINSSIIHGKNKMVLLQQLIDTIDASIIMYFYLQVVRYHGYINLISIPYSNIINKIIFFLFTVISFYLSVFWHCLHPLADRTALPLCTLPTPPLHHSMSLSLTRKPHRLVAPPRGAPCWGQGEVYSPQRSTCIR